MRTGKLVKIAFFAFSNFFQPFFVFLSEKKNKEKGIARPNNQKNNKFVLTLWMYKNSMNQFPSLNFEVDLKPKNVQIKIKNLLRTERDSSGKVLASAEFD